MKSFRFNRQIYAWSLYDWANSAFATTIMAAILPNYYSRVAADGLPATVASSYWGYTNTITMLLVAFSAPVLGAIADYKLQKKSFLAVFAGIGIFFSAMLYTVKTGDWLAASLFYMFGRIGFSGAEIFYNALLPHITTQDKIDRVSVLGYAVGYLGGGILLAINLHMIQFPEFWAIPDTATAARISFLSVAVWWAVFSIPLFIFVKEPRIKRLEKAEINPLRAGIGRLGNTFRQIKKYRQLFRYLIAYWLYNDGIGTIIVMAVIFGTEIGIGDAHLIGAILAVQFIGIPFSLLFGRLAGKIGTKGAILVGLTVYSLISIGGFFMQSAIHFWMLAIMVGLVQGGTQGLSRSLFGSMAPLQKTAEFFGFYDISTKFSGILGPALFGIIGQLTGNSRWSILALIVFFIGGGLLLYKVDVEEGRKIAAEESKIVTH